MLLGGEQFVACFAEVYVALSVASGNAAYLFENVIHFFPWFVVVLTQGPVVSGSLDLGRRGSGDKTSLYKDEVGG